MVLDLVLSYQVLLPSPHLLHEDVEPNSANKMHFQMSICREGRFYLFDEELDYPSLRPMDNV
jgi:hypothetical protein